jgi:hypothetical protein
VSIDNVHHPDPVQHPTLISNQSGQGYIWSEESRIALILQVVIPDVPPDEVRNLTPGSSGPANDSLEVGTDLVLFGNLFPSRMRPSVEAPLFLPEPGPCIDPRSDSLLDFVVSGVLTS